MHEQKIRKFGTDNIPNAKQTKVLTHVTHVNGGEPAVYMKYMSQNFGLFRVSNLSVPNFRNLLMYPGSMSRMPIEQPRFRATGAEATEEEREWAGLGARPPYLHHVSCAPLLLLRRGRPGHGPIPAHSAAPADRRGICGIGAKREGGREEERGGEGARPVMLDRWAT